MSEASETRQDDGTADRTDSSAAADKAAGSTAGALDPKAIAMAVAFEVADDPGQVGAFVESIDMGDNVTDFRFETHIVGYEGWQWSVTLYHDVELDRWTVDESSLVPTDKSLLAPKWVPWKDRLEPSDLSPTDSIGTDPDDERLEEGEVAQSSLADVEGARETFDLSRRHVLSPLGRAQTAQRWYEGPRGPKSLSTKTAAGNPCSTCGFFVPLAGDLKCMFGVCANKWSPDDGRVVSLDHGCGEHSEVEPPEPSHLWIQSDPAFDDLHIDVVAHRPSHRRKSEDDEEPQDATEEDIIANTEADDGDDDETVDETSEPSEADESVSQELEVVVDLIEQLRQNRTEAAQDDATPNEDAEDRAADAKGSGNADGSDGIDDVNGSVDGGGSGSDGADGSDGAVDSDASDDSADSEESGDGNADGGPDGTSDSGIGAGHRARPQPYEQGVSAPR